METGRCSAPPLHPAHLSHDIGAGMASVLLGSESGSADASHSRSSPTAHLPPLLPLKGSGSGWLHYLALNRCRLRVIHLPFTVFSPTQYTQPSTGSTSMDSTNHGPKILGKDTPQERPACPPLDQKAQSQCAILFPNYKTDTKLIFKGQASHEPVQQIHDSNKQKRFPE